MPAEACVNIFAERKNEEHNEKNEMKQATCENMAMTKIIQLIKGRKCNAFSFEKRVRNCQIIAGGLEKWKEKRGIKTKNQPQAIVYALYKSVDNGKWKTLAIVELLLLLLPTVDGLSKRSPKTGYCCAGAGNINGILTESVTSIICTYILTSKKVFIVDLFTFWFYVGCS